MPQSVLLVPAKHASRTAFKGGMNEGKLFQETLRCQGGTPCYFRGPRRGYRSSSARYGVCGRQRRKPLRWATGAPATSSYTVLPEKFDLRNADGANYVTDVRSQNPWGSCWSFSVIAASETSMLWDAAHDEKLDNPPAILNRDNMGLSERHLAWFTYDALPLDETDPQAGEGLHSMKAGSGLLDFGGMPLHGTSLFSSGIGPVTEATVPYQANDGLLDKEADWSVSEDKRFLTTFDIEETNVLPSSGAYFAAGDMAAGNATVQVMKEHLYQGKALAIGFMADQSRPGDEVDVLAHAYINPTNWAHYTYEQTSINHAVTIVGWDDTYPASNFGNPDPETGEVDPSHQPPRTVPGL